VGFYFIWQSSSNEKDSNEKDYVTDTGGNETTEGRAEKDENLAEPSAKRARFEADENSYQWELSAEMAEYVVKNMERFIPEKTLKEKILNDNLVPVNL